MPRKKRSGVICCIVVCIFFKDLKLRFGKPFIRKTWIPNSDRFFECPKIAPGIRYRTLMFHASGVSPIWTPWPWLCRSWTVWAYDEWGVVWGDGGELWRYKWHCQFARELVSQQHLKKIGLLVTLWQFQKVGVCKGLSDFVNGTVDRLEELPVLEQVQHIFQTEVHFKNWARQVKFPKPFGRCVFFHRAATDRSCWHLLVQRWHGFLWWKRTPLS